MNAAVITALSFGFLLGIRHALEADHLLAVTTILSRHKSLWRAVRVGISWGVGHTLTLFAAGMAVLVLRLTIPEKVALSIEALVGILMIILGIPLLWALFKERTHIHLHEHGETTHIHSHSHQENEGHIHKHIRNPLLVGMVHGMAGSGALIPLVMSTMSSVVQGLFFLLLFGMGSILGMLVFSGLIHFPFRLAGRVSERADLWMQGIAGLASIAFGIFLIWQVVFVNGLLRSFF